MLFPLTMTSVLLSLGIILLSCLIVARYRDVYEKIKIPLAIITFFSGLVLYIIGYLPDHMLEGNAAAPGEASPDIAAIALRALFSTCRIFILENDYGEVSEILRSNAVYALSFHLVHALGLMITVLTLLSLFGLHIISRMQLLFSRSSEIYIFCGLNEYAYQLIRNLRENGRNRCIIVIEGLKQSSEEEEVLVKKIRENQCILIDRNTREVESLKQLKLPSGFYQKPMHFFLFSEQEGANVQTAIKLVQNMKREGTPAGNLTLYILSSSENTGQIMDQIRLENGVNVDYRIFSIPDLAARQLMEACPIHDTLELNTREAKVHSDFTLFLAGFGRMGTEVLRKSLYSGQFHGGAFRAIVTDSAMNIREGLFNNRYSGIRDNYTIEFVQADPGSNAFFDLIKKHIHEINYVAVCLEDDRLSMETALEIQRLLRRNGVGRAVTIAVQISESEDLSHYQENILLPGICIFGRTSDIFTESIIINESMDKMARTMNALFNRIYHVEPEDNWFALDEFTRESNRSAAMNIRTKLRLLGLDMAEAGESSKQPVRLEDYLQGTRLENLAKQEHLRWNAFHFASGWTTWELSETGSAKKAKDAANKRHACLVSWERLGDVTRRFNQVPSFEELDFMQVRNIPKILEASGYIVYETGEDQVR